MLERGGDETGGAGRKPCRRRCLYNRMAVRQKERERDRERERETVRVTREANSTREQVTAHTSPRNRSVIVFKEEEREGVGERECKRDHERE